MTRVADEKDHSRWFSDPAFTLGSRHVSNQSPICHLLRFSAYVAKFEWLIRRIVERVTGEGLDLGIG